MRGVFPMWDSLRNLGFWEEGGKERGFGEVLG